MLDILNRESSMTDEICIFLTFLFFLYIELATHRQHQFHFLYFFFKYTSRFMCKFQQIYRLVVSTSSHPNQFSTAVDLISFFGVRHLVFLCQCYVRSFSISVFFAHTLSLYACARYDERIIFVISLLIKKLALPTKTYRIQF